jgi:hypothetical protein
MSQLGSLFYKETIFVFLSHPDKGHDFTNSHDYTFSYQVQYICHFPHYHWRYIV